MRNIKLTLAYDGADFHGWQLQPGLATIQGAVTEAARQITQENIFIQGASRTDAGVHALGQVAHFKTQSQLPAAEIQRALNALLPPAIRVVAAEEVGPDFHARWQAQGKTYRYRIYRGQVLPPFDYRRAYHYSGPLDEAAMAAAARHFEGEHDFTTFAASSGSEDDDRDREMTRVILSSEVVRDLGRDPGHDREKDEIDYVVRGRSFLRYMVRKIVGTLLEVGKGRLAPGDIPQIFDARDRSRSGPTVPAEGLYLVSLEYPDPTDSLASCSKSAKASPPRSHTKSR
ncbi:MAG TPA: tRNA pseudouridine(38-40) synthase TruA [Candidatus Angelobacter sp.]|jgi:tRNA pseudouridine38-40 synthase|nr:tRNA pseudouridine(38-40) synthase TruA [Candidatus Angelobacter sp.]